MSGFYDFSDLEVGMRVNVEGEYRPDGTWLAHHISIKDDGDADELEGAVTRVDAPGRTVELLGLQLDVGAGVEIKGVDKRPLKLEDLREGMRLKGKGKAGPVGRFVPQKLKVKLTTPDAMDELESEITGLDARSRRLTVMGFEVVCDADLEIEA